VPQRQDPPRRELLLDEIEAVVLAEGFRGLRVGDLASRLRCSRSTLYKLSPSKAELMRLVFARFINRAIDDAQAAAEREHTLEDKIMRFLLTLQRWQAKGSLSFWGDARDLDLVAGVLDEQSARGYRILQRYMDEGLRTVVSGPQTLRFSPTSGGWQRVPPGTLTYSTRRAQPRRRNGRDCAIRRVRHDAYAAGRAGKR